MSARLWTPAKFHIEDNHYGVFEPLDAPLVFQDVFYRILAKVRCKFCGKIGRAHV